ncbi:MAG: hypothetical protein ACOYL6_10040 [Bacteriovoracaceae bacterium]
MKTKSQNIIIFGTLILSLSVVLGAFSGAPIHNNSVDSEAIQKYFLYGQYDRDVQQGKIHRGSVRDNLNRSHVLLNHSELPLTLIQ